MSEKDKVDWMMSPEFKEAYWALKKNKALINSTYRGTSAYKKYDYKMQTKRKNGPMS
jgi:hypothetical protein